MGKKSKRTGNEPGVETGQPDPNEAVATITLSLLRSGRLSVSGQIGDKVRAYGMLAVGREIIADWHVREAAKAPAAAE